MCGINASSPQWCRSIFILCSTYLKFTLLLHKTVLVTFLFASTVGVNHHFENSSDCYHRPHPCPSVLVTFFQLDHCKKPTGIENRKLRDYLHLWFLSSWECYLFKYPILRLYCYGFVVHCQKATVVMIFQYVCYVCLPVWLLGVNHHFENSSDCYHRRHPCPPVRRNN